MEWWILILLVLVALALPFLAELAEERAEERRQLDAWTAHLRRPLQR